MIVILAIAVTTGVFLLLTAVLLVAERKLADYGTCHISVNDGEITFEQEGGKTLLATLSEQKIFIPSACGGKGSCGYCRVIVTRGGGPVLPTETPYLTRAEIRGNMRLACQVKVKSDIDLTIPDFLETVRKMVANKTYDTRTRWRWLTGPEKLEEPLVAAVTDLSPEQRLVVDAAIARHRHKRGSIVPLLQEVNSKLNHLPEAALRHIAETLGTPLSDIHRIATFYNSFSLKARGKNVIKVCLGTACYVKRGEKLLEYIERKFKVKIGECTPDNKFSIETVLNLTSR